MWWVCGSRPVIGNKINGGSKVMRSSSDHEEAWMCIPSLEIGSGRKCSPKGSAIQTGSALRQQQRWPRSLVHLEIKAAGRQSRFEAGANLPLRS